VEDDDPLVEDDENRNLGKKPPNITQKLCQYIKSKEASYNSSL
jgi:hypothetical protein